MLGVHFAITAEQERSLLAAGDADDTETVADLLEDLEENWADDDLTVDTDKAWDALHRCLGDGTLDPDGGEYPLSYAILGGRHLHDDYYVCYVTAAQVRDVAVALRQIDEAELRRRFDRMDVDEDYDGTADDEDFAYTWDGFVDVRRFYDRAAAAGRAVLFTAT
jgi:hypothetical protein